MNHPGTRAAAVERAVPVTLRELRSKDDYAACVRLQRDTWGREYSDVVPASLLKVGQLVGGVSAGAFTAGERLVGFVYGLSGIRDGRVIHWSHMLGVHPEFRDDGVGRRLKEYQRELLRGRGVEQIYWTFDPLVARNAHLNLNRLGTEVREYVPDMYGETGSPLHSFGTDRLVVSWPVEPLADDVAERRSEAGWRDAPLASTRLPSEQDCEPDAPLVRIEVPPAVEGLPMSELLSWRVVTRAAFVRLLARDYRVAGFYTEGRHRCFYVLGRMKTAGR
jgi:predicted GNAT superfamily acetyltransferase